MVFIESRAFTRQLSALGTDAEVLLGSIQSDLLDNPERGRVVPGLGGVRKARAADPARGKGKRGGFRYLCLYFVTDQEFICSICSARTSAQTSAPNSGSCFANWLRRANTRRTTMAKKRGKLFNELREALEDTRDYRLGRRTDLRVTEIPTPPKKITPREIRQIRHSLKASQTLFAVYLNVSPNAVRSWEQGTRTPQHAALKLLAIAKRNPQALLCA